MRSLGLWWQVLRKWLPTGLLFVFMISSLLPSAQLVAVGRSHTHGFGAHTCDCGLSGVTHGSLYSWPQIHSGSPFLLVIKLITHAHFGLHDFILAYNIYSFTYVLDDSWQCSGVEPGSAIYKANTFSAVLLLQPLISLKTFFLLCAQGSLSWQSMEDHMGSWGWTSRWVICKTSASSQLLFFN